jgi:hypothetical protein
MISKLSLAARTWSTGKLMLNFLGPIIHHEVIKLKLQQELRGAVDKTLAQLFESSGLHRQQKRHLVSTLRALTENLQANKKV